VNGNELKAGDYRLNVQNDKVTMVNGKQSVEVPVKVESVGAEVRHHDDPLFERGREIHDFRNSTGRKPRPSWVFTP